MSVPFTNGQTRLVSLLPGNTNVSPRPPPLLMVTFVGSPPVSFLPRHDTRSHSRTIFVSQLSFVDPLTVTSFAAFHSSVVGTADRPFGPAAAGVGLCAGSEAVVAAAAPVPAGA